MTGGLHFNPEQIRTLPLTMQIKIGLAIAATMAKSESAEGKDDLHGDITSKGNTERMAMSI